MASTSSARAPFGLNATAQLISPGVIEIKCTGHIQPEDTLYLNGLARLIDAERAPLSIVFDAMELQSYSPKFPLAHIDFFRKYHRRLRRIAVAHELRSIAFTIATVSLASNTSIKGFPSHEAALAWVREG